VSDHGEFAPTPKLLRRPADAPPPLPPVHDTDTIRTLHLGWAQSFGGDDSGVLGRLRRLVWSKKADRELLGALIRAVDVLAVRCDELADQLATMAGVTDDVTAAFGEDLTHLRAELIAARRQGQQQPEPTGDDGAR
jgi:hypothetical protein